MAGDGPSASLAGMSKNQLYDIMCQMKTLIDQNQQQARQILIQNPALTKALFQAQIILGMVQPPQAAPSIQTTPPQISQTSSLPVEQARTQAAPAIPSQVRSQEQARKPQLNQPATPSSAPLPPASNLQPPAFPSHQFQPANQAKGAMQLPTAQSSQIPNLHPLAHQSASQQPHLQPPMALASNPMQQPIHASSMLHMPLQPPLPQQARPPIPFPHSGHPQMLPNMGFQQSGHPQPHHSQSVYHMGNKPPATHGQPPLPLQPPAQPSYQVGGPHGGPEYAPTGGSSQSPWVPGTQETTTAAPHPGPAPFPTHVGHGVQQANPPLLSRDMEKALLQQVMNLTPEQINGLPPEQRNQVLQLRDMLLRQ